MRPACLPSSKQGELKSLLTSKNSCSRRDPSTLTPPLSTRFSLSYWGLLQRRWLPRVNASLFLDTSSAENNTSARKMRGLASPLSPLIAILAKKREGHLSIEPRIGSLGPGIWLEGSSIPGSWHDLKQASCTRRIGGIRIQSRFTLSYLESLSCIRAKNLSNGTSHSELCGWDS